MPAGTLVLDDSVSAGHERVVTRSGVLEQLTTTAVALGATIRVWQFVDAPSLYWGELALARNIDARSLGHLLAERTAFGQNASLGYLALQKAIVTAFGSNEFTHRLLPFIASILALLLFVRVANSYLKDSPKLVAVASFALGFPFLFITSPFKALGSVDVAVALALFLLAHHLLVSAPSWRRSLLAGLGGFALIWCAEAAMVVAAGATVTLVALALARREFGRIAHLLPAFLCWSVAVVAVTLVDQRMTDEATRAILRDLYNGGRTPPFPHVIAQLKWLYNRLDEALGPVLFHFHLRSVYLPVMALGVWPLLRRCGATGVLLLSPLVAAVIASRLGLYIFQSFYIAFLFPFLFVLFALGANVVRERIATYSKTGAFALMLGCVAIPAISIVEYPPPYRMAAMKPVLSYVQGHLRPGDVVYGFTTTAHAVAYYGPRLGFAPDAVVIGECHLGEPRKLFAELDAFRGQPRVWLLFTHDLARYNSRQEALSYLGRIGTLKDSLVINPKSVPMFVTGASAYLFDLSDGAKLATVSAENAPLLGSDVSAANSGCGAGLYSTEKP